MITLVQCTAKKREGRHEAKKLYEPSAYYRKQRAYAERQGPWYIQSAKYGLVEPGRNIQSYDVRAGDLDNPERWAKQIASDIVRLHGTDLTVQILGGANYADPLTPELEHYGIDVLEPLRGKRIGERMAWLGAQANERLDAYAP